MQISRRAFFPRAAGYLLIVFFVAAYTAGYAWSTPHTDTADELLRAYEIRHALAYPVEGPFLGGALHLGPVWFYLVALPLWISESWLAAALFIGFVCSLKFPLAYLCGRRLVDRDFGVLWAAAMFVPGWTSLEPLLFLNPNAVGAAMLLPIAIALRALDGPMHAGIFGALGLAFALAIHVHPTSAPVLLLGPMLLWIHRRRVGKLAGAVVAMIAGFVLPFLPYLVSQVRGGFSDWGSASTYMARQVSLANVVNVPSILFNYLFTGPAVIAEYLMRWNAIGAWLLGAALGGVALTSAAAAIDFPSGSRSRSRLPVLAGALLLFTAWVACMRPTTPFQFTYVLGPPVAALAAAGLWSLARAAPLRPVVALIVAALVVVNCIAMRAIAFAVRDGEGQLPARVMDIKGPAAEVIHRDIWFPALRHGELGRALCAPPAPVSLHGHLAYIVDKDLGLDALFACGDRARLVLSGSEGASHIAAMTRPFWRALGASPQCWIGSLGIAAEATPLLPVKGFAVADGSTYLPRQSSAPQPAQATLKVGVPGASAVLVTNVLGAYEYFRIVSVEAGGSPVSPLAQNDRSLLFRAPPGSGDVVDWTFTVLTTNPQAVDVVAIRDRPATQSRSVGECEPGL